MVIKDRNSTHTFKKGDIIYIKLNLHQYSGDTHTAELQLGHRISGSKDSDARFVLFLFSGFLSAGQLHSSLSRQDSFPSWWKPQLQTTPKLYMLELQTLGGRTTFLSQYQFPNTNLTSGAPIVRAHQLQPGWQVWPFQDGVLAVPPWMGEGYSYQEMLGRGYLSWPQYGVDQCWILRERQLHPYTRAMVYMVQQ